MCMLKYKVARQGKIIGEYQAGAIQRMIDSGSLMASDYAWTERGVRPYHWIAEPKLT